MPGVDCGPVQCELSLVGRQGGFLIQRIFMPYRVLTFAIVSVAIVSPSLAADHFQQVIAPNSGLNQPLFLTAPAGDSRQFVVQRTGQIRVIQNGALLPTPFLDISSKVDLNGERGLLGLAFAPDFATTGNFYVDYINNTNFSTTVERYTATPSSNTANTTGTLVFSAAQPSTTNHKGGWIGFRPGDGNNLYIATGDGGGANDTSNNAQTLTSPLGKIHRINPLGAAPNTPAAGNPFIGGATTADDTVWAYGLRNPFRDSFDRATGNFYIADVGQDTREELNVENAMTGGRNYGWRTREGLVQNPAYPIASNPIPPNAVNPVLDYAHNSSFGTGSSGTITGGYVYRGPLATDLVGQYIFADYLSGHIGSTTYDPISGTATGITDLTSVLNPGNSLFAQNTLAAFGEDSVGNLYALNLGNGAVYILVPEPSSLAAFVPVLALLGRRRR